MVHPALAILFSIVCAGLVIWVLGFNPFVIFPSMVKGALGTEIRLTQTILKAYPDRYVLGYFSSL